VNKTPLHATVLKHNIIISEVLRFGTAKESDIPEYFIEHNWIFPVMFA
jgi:hypothetical protein